MLNVEELRQRWQGVCVPLITPFTEDSKPDLAALERNVQWLIDKGARVGNTVFLAAGSGGDFTSMTTEERKQVIKTVRDVAGDRVPVMASAQSTDVRECIELCQFGETLGLDAMQIAGPYYYDGRPGDVLAWLQEVAKHTGIAFAIYNNWYTGYNMPLGLLDEILDIPNSRAMKWGAPDVSTFLEGIRRFNPRAALIGNHFQLAELFYPRGVLCHISHIPNFYPEHSWRVHSLFMAGKLAEASKEWDRCFVPWLRLTGLVAAQTAGEGVYVRPAMELVGLKGGRSPLPSRDTAIGPALREQYRQVVAQFHAGA